MTNTKQQPERYQEVVHYNCTECGQIIQIIAGRVNRKVTRIAIEIDSELGFVSTQTPHNHVDKMVITCPTCKKKLKLYVAYMK